MIDSQDYKKKWMDDFSVSSKKRYIINTEDQILEHLAEVLVDNYLEKKKYVRRKRTKK